MPERGRGPAISVRVVGEGLPGKVLFEHRSEESEGTYQWNLRDKLSGQRAEALTEVRAQEVDLWNWSYRIPDR